MPDTTNGSHLKTNVVGIHLLENSDSLLQQPLVIIWERISYALEDWLEAMVWPEARQRLYNKRRPSIPICG